MRVDADDEESMMEWMLCVYLSIRYVQCFVCCVTDKHTTMFCVTGIDLVKRI